MFYGASAWDPVLIIAQIVTLQCLYYISLGTLLYVFLGNRYGQLTIEVVFDYTKFSIRKTEGGYVIGAFVASAFVGAFLLYFIVERTKKCLDFTATLYIIQTCGCIFYKGFPTLPEWWITMAISVVIMAVLGEWLCMHKEMRDIPIGGSNARANRGLPVVNDRSTRRNDTRSGLLRFMAG